MIIIRNSLSVLPDIIYHLTDFISALKSYFYLVLFFFFKWVQKLVILKCVLSKISIKYLFSTDCHVNYLF